MTASAIEAFKTAQAALIDALQHEYYADDLILPPQAFGWTPDQIITYFESAGTTLPSAMSATPEPSTALVPEPPPGPIPCPVLMEPPPGSIPCPVLMAFLETEGMPRLCERLAEVTWDECAALHSDSRAKLMARLGQLGGITLPERQRFATSFGKAAARNRSDQPGGGRPQPVELYKVQPIDMPGKDFDEIAQDTQGYQAHILASGLALRKAGLFPPKDEWLAQICREGWRPCSKGLPHPTKDGRFVFATVEAGWVVGEGAVEHGIDLRWFIRPGFDERVLLGAVRFSEAACIGCGFPKSSVHGGCIETCLDEVTAEVTKSKLFPLATTAKIEFKISRPVQPGVTYRVQAAVKEEVVEGISYNVEGVITDPHDHNQKYAWCMAKMANAFSFGRQL